MASHGAKAGLSAIASQLNSSFYSILALLKLSKISAKLYNLLYWMSPDHILGWPQARLELSVALLAPIR